jgi:hypothetical protein
MASACSEENDLNLASLNAIAKNGSRHLQCVGLFIISATMMGSGSPRVADTSTAQNWMPGRTPVKSRPFGSNR